MEQPGPDEPHRDKNGQIARKHGDTLISTLRGTYGDLAPDCPPDGKLIDVLSRRDECR